MNLEEEAVGNSYDEGKSRTIPCTLTVLAVHQYFRINVFISSTLIYSLCPSIK